MTIPGFFEGTGMPDPGWWEALWPDPAKVLLTLALGPAWTWLTFAAAMDGLRFHWRSWPAALSQSTLTALC
jgi:hypothetical protein